MPSFFDKLKASSSSSKKEQLQMPHGSSFYYGSEAPPEWAPAPEASYVHGLRNEASSDDYEVGENFCRSYPLYPPRPVPSAAVDRIRSDGALAWGIELPHANSRFRGKIENIAETSKGQRVVKVHTEDKCREHCLVSNLPIMAGMYTVDNRKGVYYEVKVHKMKGIIAIGTTVLPYPEFRFPGWNRQSAGLHLDDMRKFFEDPDGGRDYSPALPSSMSIKEDDIFGCGLEFDTGALFYTYNGLRLENAFTGLYRPRNNYDVFAAIGVEGHCKFEINFGGDLFKWAEGNEWHWKLDGIITRFAETNSFGDELPAYSA